MKKQTMKKQTKAGSARETSRQHTGISNRESATEEAAERAEHPPQGTGAPQASDAAGNSGESRFGPEGENQTSHKAGSRSIAQKESEARYPDRSMPPSRKVAGAFGKERRK